MRDAHQVLAQMSEADLGKMIKELGRYALSVSRSKPRWRTDDPISPYPNKKILLSKMFIARGKTDAPHGRVSHKHTKHNLQAAEG